MTDTNPAPTAEPRAASSGEGSPVRFGFLGAGWIAHRALAPAVHSADGAVLQAAAARDADRARSLAPAGRAYDSYDALLADPDVDVVYVNLGNDGHRPWTTAALRAGKHVLCEKPLGLDPAEVAEMTQAAEAAGRLLVEAFWYRWHPRTRRLEQLVAEGAVGRVQYIEAEFSFDGGGEDRMRGNYRLDPARGGGALLDVGCYSVSAAHTVLGPDLALGPSLPGAAGSVDRRTGPTGVDVSTSARLACVGGPHAGADVVVRCGIEGRDHQVLRVVGDAATVELSPGEPFTSWHAPASLTVTTPDGSVRTEDFAAVDPYRLMVEAVAARVRGRSAFLPGPEHSAHVAATLALIGREVR